MSFFYNSPIKFNIQNLSFRSAPVIPASVKTQLKDCFVSNTISENFAKKAQIEFEARQNPRIQNLLAKYNLPVQVNIDELENLKNGHLKDTRTVAVKIYSSLPEELKKNIDLKSVQEASLLHDFGKVFIPKRILNKKGVLNDREKEIIKLHSELGYELLKNKGLSENTLNLIKYHHQTPLGDGYPLAERNYEHSLEAQILNLADKYCALREKRSYKMALPKEKTLAILENEVNSGTISKEVYDALIKAV